MSESEMPAIEVTGTEFLSGMTANAQALIAQADWMLECGDRTHRYQGDIPSYPVHEIEGPWMRCGCGGSTCVGHPEHLGALANPEQHAVADYLLDLEIKTPVNWILVREWLNFRRIEALWDRDRDPPLYWDDQSYAYSFYAYREDAALQRSDESLLRQAQVDFRDDMATYEKWTRNVKRLTALRAHVAQFPNVIEVPIQSYDNRDVGGAAGNAALLGDDVKSRMRREHEYALRETECAVEHSRVKELPVLRTLEEQRAWAVKDNAESMVSLQRQVAKEKQAMYDVIPEFKAFLAGLNPAEW